MMASPLRFSLDLSKVECGCLACIYLVAMPDPDARGDAYTAPHSSLTRDPARVPTAFSSAPCPPNVCACVFNSYCDMAENVIPGLDGEMCIELDVLEANNWAMQTAVHTEQGGKFGSGNCDRNGCFARALGPGSASTAPAVHRADATSFSFFVHSTGCARR